MSCPTWKQYCSFAIRDSGPPAESGDYTTLIIFHGLQFHSATFDKLFPFVAGLKIRLVTVNRPGYPGATPLSELERKKLDKVSEGQLTNKEFGAAVVLDHIKASAKKAYDFLVQYVSGQGIQVSGGIIVIGWSFGSLIVLGLLAYADDFLTNDSDINLRAYLKHVVLYDPPSTILGYPPPQNFYSPFTDPLLTPGEVPIIFPLWVSGHYAHGDNFVNLRCGYTEALCDPPPTAVKMDPSEAQRCIESSSMRPTGGSDAQVLVLGATLGAFARLKDAALYLEGVREQKPLLNNWDDVQIKYVWCDQSAWEMPWSAICLQDELKENSTNLGRGRLIRRIEMVRLRGANHLYHWEEPEAALKRLLMGNNGGE